jgi:hypothetical protein
MNFAKGCQIMAATTTVAVGLLAYTWNHWWPKSRSFWVTYDNVIAHDTDVYDGKDCFLLRLPAASDSRYVIYPLRGELGEAIHDRFRFFPGFVYSLDLPATYVWLGEMEIDGQIRFKARSVKFNDAKASA